MTFWFIKRVRIVAVGICKPEVDGVVVFAVLVPAHFAAKEGAAQAVPDLLRAQPITARFVAVDGDGHFRLGLFDVEFQTLHSFDPRGFNEALHAIGVGECRLVIGTGDFEVDGQALRWTVGVLGRPDEGVGIALDLVADGVEHIVGPEALAVLELQEAHRDAAFVGVAPSCGPSAGSEVPSPTWAMTELVKYCSLGPSPPSAQKFGAVDGAHDHARPLG